MLARAGFSLTRERTRIYGTIIHYFKVIQGLQPLQQLYTVIDNKYGTVPRFTYILIKEGSSKSKNKVISALSPNKRQKQLKRNTAEKLVLLKHAKSNKFKTCVGPDSSEVPDPILNIKQYRTGTRNETKLKRIQ